MIIIINEKCDTNSVCMKMSILGFMKLKISKDVTDCSIITWKLTSVVDI